MDKLNRRSLMVAAAGAWSGMAVGQPTRVASSSTSASPRLWYRRPAAGWNEALPVANGRTGAMVFGRVGQERLQLNEDTLWAGSPYSPENPDSRDALGDIRALIAARKYREAEDLAGRRMMARPWSQMPYGSLGDILLTMADAVEPGRYERALDLRDAIATVCYGAGPDGHRRYIFASAPDSVIVLRMEATGRRLNFALEYRGPRDVEQISPDYAGAATPAAASAAPVKWLDKEDIGSTGDGVTIVADGDRAVLIKGRNQPSSDVPAGLTYAVRIEAIGDGTVRPTPRGLTVDGARTITLVIAAATSYVNYHDVTGDPVKTVRTATAAAARKGYAALRRDHVADHRALFDRFNIDLGRTAAAERPTDERIAAAETSNDPALAALYTHYARYLMIASSRPGGQAANLQGLWNEGLNPPWGSKYTININTEMNYWPAAPAALNECIEPLLAMVEDIAVTGARTARAMYGSDGWVTHHNIDLWRATAPIDYPSAGLWPCGGAWLCVTLWNHWDHVRDLAMLERLYPLMAGAARFFLDTLVEDPNGRGLVTSPSLSPENAHPFGSALCAGPAMDRQILRDLFDHTIDAGHRLKQDPALLERIARTRARLAPDRIGSAGQLQEWLEDWDARAPDIHHRHVSHLYAIYPSSQINVRDTPKLVDAAKTTLRQRGDLTTGWGTAWRACLWARMGEGDHAHAILRGLLGPQRTYPNLFDAHPPFQIDGNFGGAAAVMEMIAQSWGGEILLLPALPKAWPSGSVRGLRLRGGLGMDLSWAAAKVRRVTLTGKPGDPVVLRVAGRLVHDRLGRNGRLTRAAF